MEVENTTVALQSLPRVNFEAEKRLLIGGNYWHKNFKKKGFFKKEQKKLMNERKSKCGCLRFCVCGKNRKLGEHSSPSQLVQYEVIGRNLFDSIKQIDQYVELDFEIFISQDGTVRLNGALSQICFGWWQGQAERIQNNKVDGIINVVRKKEIKNLNKSFEEALKILASVPDSLHQEIAISLTKFINTMQEYKQEYQYPKQLTEEQMEEKDLKFIQFSNLCFQYLKTVPKESMYVYNIGRINPLTKDLEVIHTGYSQTYLNLLGIDLSSLSSLLLRRKSIDLVTNVADITRISGHTMDWIQQIGERMDSQSTQTSEVSSSSSDCNCQFDPIACRIVTFDGFPLTLYQAGSLVPNQESNCGNIFQVYNLRVDDNELEALISYRKRLISQSGNLLMEDFLKQQLSLLLEDVEYSVLSSNFLEKYYSEEMLSLSSLQANKINNIFEQRCGIKSAIEQ